MAETRRAAPQRWTHRDSDGTLRLMTSVPGSPLATPFKVSWCSSSSRHGKEGPSVRGRHGGSVSQGERGRDEPGECAGEGSVRLRVTSRAGAWRLSEQRRLSHCRSNQPLSLENRLWRVGCSPEGRRRQFAHTVLTPPCRRSSSKPWGSSTTTRPRSD